MTGACYAVDPFWPDHDAAIGDRGVGSCEFQERHFRAAERQAGVAMQLAGDAELTGFLCDLVPADMLGKTDGRRVDGVAERVADADPLGIGVVGIAWPPAIDVDRQGGDAVIRLKSPLRERPDTRKA